MGTNRQKPPGSRTSVLSGRLRSRAEEALIRGVINVARLGFLSSRFYTLTDTCHVTHAGHMPTVGTHVPHTHVRRSLNFACAHAAHANTYMHRQPCHLYASKFEVLLSAAITAGPHPCFEAPQMSAGVFPETSFAPGSARAAIRASTIAFWSPGRAPPCFESTVWCSGRCPFLSGLLASAPAAINALTPSTFR